MENKLSIREMKKEDIPQVTEILGRAYATNPVFLAIFRDKTTIAHRLQMAFKAMFEYRPGKIFVVELDGQMVGGAQIAKSPDCQAMNPKVLPHILSAVGFVTFIRMMKVMGAWKNHDHKQPHWHLGVLGIDPEFQHKGIGSHWMTFYCSLIDKDKIEAYHETERPGNVPFYGRFGFKVVEEQMVNGVKTWYMLRPAKSG